MAAGDMPGAPPTASPVASFIIVGQIQRMSLKATHDHEKEKVLRLQTP
jgi:hypothetical protein